MTRRRIRILLLSVGFGSAMLLGVAANTTYRYVTHDPRFCNSCHIMEEPFKKWSASPHHLVDCHECHSQTSLEGLRQLWFYVTQRPKAVVHHPELNHATCAKCHLSQDPQWKLVGETAGHKVHFERAKIDCLDCHMGGVHEFLRPTEACVTCHADKGDSKNKMAFVHCTECHNFLGKNSEGLAPTRERCLACHEKIRVERETFPEGAPMHEDCGMCHKPHGQLKFTPTDCLTCHADLKGPGHDAASRDQCFSCHKPHTWKARAKP
ncbi:MAG: NapC/NirT family cytochrome c [Deltaproteobacteria bacterium]|nr:NapC/NirT family cytochrome c [Deltaproteobacteria bacterium]